MRVWATKYIYIERAICITNNSVGYYDMSEFHSLPQCYADCYAECYADRTLTDIEKIAGATLGGRPEKKRRKKRNSH